MREFVMSEARRRKQAVWVRAGRGVVSRWVVRKLESHVVFGVRDFVAVSWADIWAAGSDIALGFQWGVCPSPLNAVPRATGDIQIIEIFHESFASELPFLLSCTILL